MIDVARYKPGDACPRCPERRVHAIDEDQNLWLCIPNALPAPWRLDQIRKHDAETSG